MSEPQAPYTTHADLEEQEDLARYGDAGDMLSFRFDRPKMARFLAMTFDAELLSAALVEAERLEMEKRKH